MSLRSSLRKSTVRLVSFFFLPLIACAGSAPAQQVKDLKPQGYVNDFAGVLSAPAKDKLAALCAEVDRKAGAQIAVVTVSHWEASRSTNFRLTWQRSGALDRNSRLAVF